MIEVAEDRVIRSSIERESEVRPALTVFSTSKHIEVMVFGHIKLIVQRVRCAPSPACSYLAGSLVSGAEAVLVGLIGIIDRQEATPGPRAGVVVDLSAVDEVLDGLNLDIGVGIKVLADALVVAALAVDQLIDGVEGERVVVLPAFVPEALMSFQSK